MRVCLICEGSYPYVLGGVSNWVHMICNKYQDIEFAIWAIVTNRKDNKEYKYNIPNNVKEVRTIYIEDAKFKPATKDISLTQEEKEDLKSLMNDDITEYNWNGILKLAKKYHNNIGNLLLGKSFYNICKEEYCNQHSKKAFLSFLWNCRGMYLPLLYLLSQDIPKADIYHSVCAGYAGILGSCASYINDKPFLLSEHGIYTREREEDIIRSTYVGGEFKETWIKFFKRLSFIAYQQAKYVTTLFDINKQLQIELGCPEEKIVIIPNGVDVNGYKSCIKEEIGNPITLGTILRVVPIKDVKTLLLAFDVVKEKYPNVKLKIMGNYNESQIYYNECIELLNELGTSDVEFLGQVNIKEHLKDIDLLLLSSISEGQPFAILEGLSAQIPFVATDVGNCRALLEGFNNNDNFGKAGIIVSVMNSDRMAKEIIYLIENPDIIKRMGIAGRRRVEKYYNEEQMFNSLYKLYKELQGKQINGRESC